ncbi:MAG: SpoIID/LytB domain-containing protein [Sedimentisphaerales bacterium]|nr:SpoIID/LytB domain-containing protein [Sedimentisphaerales bacterium]
MKDAVSCRLDSAGGFEAVSNDTSNETPAEKRLPAEDRVSIEISGGIVTIGGEQFAGDEIDIRSVASPVFKLNGQKYRGALKVIVGIDGESFDVVNHVDLESYLAGVVGAEMPDYWEPEALKAQTIAARTYCLYIKQRFGSGRSWDMRKTQAHQVYRGVTAESPPIWRAVTQTRGTVLVCRSGDEKEVIFPAYYSSACGGHTEDSRHVFGDSSYDSLAGVQCDYCASVARPRYYFWPIVKFDCATVSERLHQRYPTLDALGEITDIKAVEQSDYGTYRRLTKIKLTGSTGKSDFVRAEDLRLSIDPSGRALKSTICEIRKSGHSWVFSYGRGFGHGVGLCQCGAQAMAREGFIAGHILAYYYPNSRSIKAY